MMQDQKVYRNSNLNTTYCIFEALLKRASWTAVYELYGQLPLILAYFPTAQNRSVVAPLWFALLRKGMPSITYTRATTARDVIVL